MFLMFLCMVTRYVLVQETGYYAGLVMALLWSMHVLLGDIHCDKDAH